MGDGAGGQSRGQDAGGWFDSEVAKTPIQILSHEHTYNEERAVWSPPVHPDAVSEMVGRRLREGRLFRTHDQLKLRYKDFTTFTRAHSVDRRRNRPEIYETVRRLFLQNWKQGAAIRLLGGASLEFRSGTVAD